jgi:hypothetical protein
VDSWIDLTALWQIVVVGLLAGAGLPALFAVGLKLLSLPGSDRTVAVATGPDADDHGGTRSDTLVGGNIAGIIGGALCFLIILAAVGWGIVAIYQAGHK